MLNENLLPALITLGNVTRSIMPIWADVLKCHKLCSCCFTLTVSLALSPDTCPNNASYYGNRAATLMMLGRFREALEDAQQSVRLDDTFVRVRGDLQAPHSVPCLHLFQLLQLLFPVFPGPSPGREVPPFPRECHGCQPLLSTSSRTGS